MISEIGMNRILKCDILQMQFKKGGVKSSLLG